MEYRGGDGLISREQDRACSRRAGHIAENDVSGRGRVQRPHQVSQDIMRNSIRNTESENNVRIKQRPYQVSVNTCGNTEKSKRTRKDGKEAYTDRNTTIQQLGLDHQPSPQSNTDFVTGGVDEFKKEGLQVDLSKSEEKAAETNISDGITQRLTKPAMYEGKNKGSRKTTPVNIAQVLLNENSFCCMENQLYLYCGKYWKLIRDSEANREIRSIIPDDLKSSISKWILNEIYEWLLIKSSVKQDCIKERRCYLNFADQAYNWESGQTEEERKDLMFKYALQLPISWAAQEGNGTYKNFIKDTFGKDGETIREFRKFLGLCLSDIRDLKMCFFLYGPSNSGKTVVLNLLKKIVGEEWCSSVSFTQMSNEFAITQLLGKRLNLSGEVSGASNKRLDILKSLTGNDSVTASFKGKDHFQFRNEALLVFACNSFPPINALEEIDSFLSRVIIFPFSNIVPRDKWIDNFEEVLMEDAGNIIKDAIKGLRELREDGYCFKESLQMKRCKQSFKGQYNSFALYADEHILKEIEGQVTSEEIKKRYRVFCEEEGYETLSDNVWTLYLKQRFGCVSKTFVNSQGERKRGYQGIRIK